MPTSRVLVIAACAALGAGAAAPTASAAVDCYADGAPVCLRAAAQGPRSTSGSVRPKRIDSIAYTVPIVGITWSSWTRTRAVGVGRLLRCGGCIDPGIRVRVVLTRPVRYFCGEEPAPIGVWFSRATLSSTVASGKRRIIDDGHPNVC